ncbi:MAG: retroviral-like aspartic protease family protein [Pseudomonadales bacterium]|nr:retroviral-like aspartic protease family protein [Pseudomonadales bacterium]
MRNLFRLLGCIGLLAAGVGTGWALPVAAQQTAYLSYIGRHGEGFEVLMALADLANAASQYPAAIDYLLRAAQQVDNQLRQRQLEASLLSVTDSYARTLVGRHQYAVLDRVYEDITLALPELGDYFLALGLLRLQTGNPQAALAVLAQIQNHGRLGSQARQLMADIEVSESEVLAGLEVLPLRQQDGHLLVDALLDNRLPVTLLIDTGATVTILEPRALARLGYNLQGRQAYFATANGVVQAPVLALGRLALGEAGISQLAVGALELQLGESIDGLLGMNFLRHYQFRIDQDQGRLILERQRRKAP